MTSPSDRSAWASAFAPGTRLGDRYLVEGVIGDGGMGVVVAAMDERLARTVALKLLHPGRSVTDTSRHRFLREARAAASIDSEHVVRVFDTGVLEDVGVFLAMERLEGQDLRQALKEQGRFPLAVAIEIILQTCSALEEAHRRGIVHRDLKPANLFLVRRGRDQQVHVKVLDFGISKVAVDPRRGLEEATADSLTDTGSAVGSPRYMSPEQVRDARGVGPASDIWSLGVVLYELLVGETPFIADSAPALYAMIAADSPRPLRDLRPDLPQAIEDVCSRCLAKRPEARFSSVADLARALQRVVAETGPGASDRSKSHASLDDDTSLPGDPNSKTLDPAPPTESDGQVATKSRALTAVVVSAGVVLVTLLVFALRPANRSTSTEAELRTLATNPSTVPSMTQTPPTTETAREAMDGPKPQPEASVVVERRATRANPPSSRSPSESLPKPNTSSRALVATPPVQSAAPVQLTDEGAMETRK